MLATMIRVPQTRKPKQQTFFSTFWRLRSLRSKHQEIQHLVRTYFLVWRQPLSCCIFTWWKEWALVSSSPCVSRSVMSDSLQPHGEQPFRLLCPWDFPGKNTGVGCHSLLQGIFLTQGLNLGLLRCREILYCLSHQGITLITPPIPIWRLHPHDVIPPKGPASKYCHIENSVFKILS